MKETPISNCEKNFIIQAIKQNQRLDGRRNDEFRPLKINYGADWGSVVVALGETKVLAQVSSELGIPKATRPNEGMLNINVELGPMAAPHFETGRNCELTVQLNRTLERTFRDSRCVDLESLCITAEERVWILRIDINVLNHEGNLIDCCSIAALCALAHFRRPEVSLVEDEVIVHTSAEKDFLPMVMHHYPVCVSYCTFDDGRIAVADPTVMEERTSESQMIFGINSFRELCCLNLGGSSLTSSTLLLQSSKRAANQAKNVVEMIKETIKNDDFERQKPKNVGFTECLKKNTITSLAEDRLVLKLRDFTFYEVGNDKRNYEIRKIDDNNDSEYNGEVKEEVLDNISNASESITKWIPEDNDEDASSTYMDASSDMDNRSIDRTPKKNKKVHKPAITTKHQQTSQSDSEEEDVVVLN